MFKENNSKTKILYIVKDKLHRFPPCVSQIVMLRELGCSVYVITEECDEATLKVLCDSGADVKILGNLNSQKGIWGVFLHFFRFAHAATKEIKRIYNPEDLLWAATEGTAITLTPLLRKRKFVMEVLELYSMPFHIKFLKRIIKYAQAVIVCEKNRGRIMQQWYGLERLPYIMPNKPHYDISQEKSIAVEQLQSRLFGKKYILYQGILSKDRSLGALAKALAGTKEKYTLVIIGRSASGEEQKILTDLQKHYKDIVYGGFFPAPQHLYITENAYIGVAFYDTSCLNNMFCAPNKIFEYSKFNVPILGNDIPGLQTTVEKHGAGICVDIDNPDEIAKAIDQISENYAEYQKGAEKLYNSVDNLETTRTILKKIGFIK